MSEPLRCIIVDDEEGAHLVIGHYLQGMRCLTLCGTFYNAIEAMDHIYRNPVDLVFLDINMPGLSGMEMLEAMSNPPLIILTTAYSEYALEGYKYQVVDYLVKPIELPKFVAAVNKVFSRYKPRVVAAPQAPAFPDFLMLKVEGDMLRIMLENISYIQSWGNYIKVHTNDTIYISAATTTEIEQKLDRSRFRRIHKSYIVALDQVQRITGTQVCLKNNTTLPVGNTFRRELLEYFQGNLLK